MRLSTQKKKKKIAISHTVNKLIEVGFKAKCPDSSCKRKA